MNFSWKDLIKNSLNEVIYVSEIFSVFNFGGVSSDLGKIIKNARKELKNNNRLNIFEDIKLQIICIFKKIFIILLGKKIYYYLCYFKFLIYRYLVKFSFNLDEKKLDIL